MVAGPAEAAAFDGPAAASISCCRADSGGCCGEDAKLGGATAFPGKFSAGFCHKKLGFAAMLAPDSPFSVNIILLRA